MENGFSHLCNMWLTAGLGSHQMTHITFHQCNDNEAAEPEDSCSLCQNNLAVVFAELPWC